MTTEVDKAKPMAVLPVLYPDHCCACPIESICEGLVAEKPEGCPLRKAIGIIEPNGNVRYFREDNDAGDN